MQTIQQIIAETPPDQLKDKLETYAVSITTQEIPRYFTEEEIDNLKSLLADNSVKISRASLALARAKKIYKEATKGIIKTNAEIVIELREGYEQVEGTVYEIDDQDAGMMLSYDVQGNLLSKRPLKPNERQGKLFNLQSNAR